MFINIIMLAQELSLVESMMLYWLCCSDTEKQKKYLTLLSPKYS